MSCSSTQNSSPPMRATKSSPRTAARSRDDITLSRLSPTSRPGGSFTRFKVSAAGDEGVAARRGAQPRRHHLEQAVADVVAERVVHLLEVVEVEEEERRGL